jgi:hypothetical protein
VQVGDPQRRSLADDFIATIGDLDSGVVDAAPPPISKKEAAAARTSARVIKAARALSAASPAPAVPTPSDSSSTPASPSRGTEGERHDQAPAPSAHSVRVAHPRRLVNFFPESALEPEKPSTSSLTAASVAQTSFSSRPAAMVSEAPSPAAHADAAPSAAGVAPAPSIESTSQVREPFELARSELLAAIRAGGGPALLTGPAGVGKTTLCRALIQDLDSRTVASVVSGAPQSFDDLLKTMLVNFGVMTTETSAAAHAAQSMLMSTLDCFLESLVVLRARAVVFIDDAHKIPAGALAELEALRAPGSASARVLQLVLVGRPSLRSVLKRADLNGLDASIVRRMNLVPVHVHESAAAAARPAAVYNALTDSAAINLTLVAPRTPSPLFKRLLLIAAAALIVLAGVLWVWRDAVGRTILQ